MPSASIHSLQSPTGISKAGASRPSSFHQTLFLIPPSLLKSYVRAICYRSPLEIAASPPPYSTEDGEGSFDKSDNLELQIAGLSVDDASIEEKNTTLQDDESRVSTAADKDVITSDNFCIHGCRRCSYNLRTKTRKIKATAAVRAHKTTLNLVKR